MAREYKVGQVLRQLYNDFLGECREDEIYAYSSDSSRTKQSLQLILAGLCPVSKKRTWNNDIKWSPIPTHYDKLKFNFLNSVDACRTYRSMQQEIEQSVEIKNVFKKYEDFAEKMHNKTGEIYEIPKMYRLYNNLKAALSLGLPLPDWCTDQDYEILQEITYQSYFILTHTPLMTKIAAGPTVEKFLENIEKNGKGLNEKKLFLYSGHEINIAQLRNAHNFTEIPKIPDYGCTLIVEKLRGKDDQVYVRFVVWPGVGEELIRINVKDCGYECPLVQYKSLIQSILPNAESRSCFPTCET